MFLHSKTYERKWNLSAEASGLYPRFDVGLVGRSFGGSLHGHLRGPLREVKDWSCRGEFE